MQQNFCLTASLTIKDAQRDYDDVHLVANVAQSQAIAGISSYIDTIPARDAAIGPSKVGD